MMVGFAYFIQSLVYPVPHASTNHTLGFIFDIVPILGNIARSISHRVCILTEEIGFIGLLLVEATHVRNARIHVRVNIGSSILSLVVYRTCRFQFLGYFIHSHKILSGSNLVTQ